MLRGHVTYTTLPKKGCIDSDPTFATAARATNAMPHNSFVLSNADFDQYNKYFPSSARTM